MIMILLILGGVRVDSCHDHDLAHDHDPTAFVLTRRVLLDDIPEGVATTSDTGLKPGGGGGGYVFMMQTHHWGSCSRRRDCHLMAPPCNSARCFNRDNQGVSVK